MSSMQFKPGIYVAIDCGTGSMRMQALRVHPNGDHDLVENLGVDHGVAHDLRELQALSEETIQQIENGVQLFVEKADELGAVGVVAAGTESFRAAKNGAEVLQRMADLGVPFQLLSGYDELQVSLFGAMPYLKGLSENFYFADSGGGSTEIGLIKSSDYSIQAGISLKVGVSAWSHQLALLGDKNHPEHLHDAIEQMTQKFTTGMELWDKPQTTADLVVAGAPMHLLRYFHKELEPVPNMFAGHSLTRAEVEQLALEMAEIGISGRETNPYISGRGTILLPAALKVLALMNATGATAARITPSGICAGLCLLAAQIKDKNLAS